MHYFLINSLLSIHYNRCTRKVSPERPCIMRRKSSPNLSAAQVNLHSNNHTLYTQSITTDDIDRVKKLIELQEEEEEDLFEEMDIETQCGCGAPLSTGWACDNCRRSCPGCNRALTNDPQDYCSRCESKCQDHGLFNKGEHSSCPEC